MARLRREKYKKERGLKWVDPKLSGYDDTGWFNKELFFVVFYDKKSKSKTCRRVL